MFGDGFFGAGFYGNGYFGPAAGAEPPEPPVGGDRHDTTWGARVEYILRALVLLFLT